MLIYTRHDPRFFDRRLQKGGDVGAGEMRKMEEERQAKVQAAVDAINGKFGIAPAGPSPGASIGPGPDRAKFEKANQEWVWTGDGNGEWHSLPGGFDQAGFDAATADYNARKAAAEGATTDLSGAKSARESAYSSIAGAVRDTALRDLDRQYSQASNKNIFGLARAGLLGGSSDAESGGELRQLYGEGRIKAEQAGQTAAADLRSTDEKTRQNLISLAQSGLDTGTASSLASAQTAAAADSARGAAAGASVGRLFDDLSQAYVANQVTKTRYPNGTQQPGSGYGTPNLYGTNRYTGTVRG